MKAEKANSMQQDILGNGHRSEQEIFSSVLTQWRKKLGYCSIFGALPGLLVSQVEGAHSVDPKKPTASVAVQSMMRLERLSMSRSNPALLKRQSEFLLPHQMSTFAALAPALAGNDDCPGRAIPGGNYTAAAPYIDSADTTGANNTITRLCYYYCYYTYDALGPDHIYSFTLTGRGPNPQIEVSATSSTYSPLIYVLQGGFAEACPTGTGNTAYNMLLTSDAPPGGIVKFSGLQMDVLPLNVPLYLFVDSFSNGANSSGTYTIRMQDVTIAPVCPNSIDCAEFFVHQHYLDFLTRQADSAGLAFWTHEIDLCSGDQQCIEAKRINVSAAFFLSIEFQETGFLVHRLYKSSFDNLAGAPVPLRLDEFLTDTQKIGLGVIVNQSGWETVLENNKQAFTLEFVQRSRFTSVYPTSLTPDQFVDQLFLNAGVTPSSTDRAAAIDEFGGAVTSADVAARARALRRIADNSTLRQQEFNKAFVLMQYFGYLRRNPNDAPEPGLNFNGYNFWLAKLDQFNGDFAQAEMVKSFLVSTEYRQRFAQP